MVADTETTLTLRSFVAPNAPQDDSCCRFERIGEASSGGDYRYFFTALLRYFGFSYELGDHSLWKNVRTRFQVVSSPCFLAGSTFGGAGGGAACATMASPSTFP